MSWILDGIVVLVVGISLFLGYRRGFIRTAVQLAGYVLAFFIAISLSASIADFTYDRFIGNGIRENIAAAFSENAGATVSEKIEGAIESLPDFVQTALAENKSVQNVLSTVDQKTENTIDAVTETVVEQIVRPVAVALLRFISFLILFLVLLLLVALLGKLVKPITKLPLIHQVDGTLGLVLGLAKGCILAFVAVTVMQLISTSGSTTGPFTVENLENSMLAGWLAKINPLASILKF